MTSLFFLKQRKSTGDGWGEPSTEETPHPAYCLLRKPGLSALTTGMSFPRIHWAPAGWCLSVHFSTSRPRAYTYYLSWKRAFWYFSCLVVEICLSKMAWAAEVVKWWLRCFSINKCVFIFFPPLSLLLWDISSISAWNSYIAKTWGDFWCFWLADCG